MGTNLAPFEIDVEKLVYGGDGLARRDGQVILTPYVLPGERVEVTAEEERAGLLRARLLRVVTPAAERVAAVCPYFARCGGCHYQQAGYDVQLAAKRAILIETLARVGKLAAPGEIRLVHGEPWGYRNRAQFHIDGTGIGYLEARSHKLCTINQCPIASPRIHEALTIVRQMLHDPKWPRFVGSVELFTNETDLQLNVLETERPVARRFFDWCGEMLGGPVSGAIEYPAAGALYHVSHNAFSQVNRFLVDQLVKNALEQAEGENALDLYAGVGLFSLPLARRFAQVTAVESSSAAVRDLAHNAERAGVTVSTQQMPVDAFLSSLETTPEFVLADPPRAGLGASVVKELTRLAPPRITIVACDPATLARDLAGLTAAGYQIAGMTLIDLFPQTFHIETVVHLRR
jgi:23S rRNA (uracil1939-C5)-methyltransferase